VAAIDELPDKWRPLAAAGIDAYEAGVRAGVDLQRAAARVIQVEPARSLATASADLTRDIGAVAASRARWLLDL
jgi:hypothetical protein